MPCTECWNCDGDISKVGPGRKFCSDACQSEFVKHCAPKSKLVKRREAAERSEYWSSLSYSDQLSQLCQRRGNSTKQVEKIRKHLDKLISHTVGIA